MQKFIVGVLLLSTAVTASGQIFGSAGAAKYVAPRGGTLPATCSFAQLFMKSGSGVGLYACTATDTWTLLGVTGAGTGDVIGPSASLDGEAALFDSTTGKLLKRFSGSGLMIATSGVPSVDSGLQWSNATKGIGVFGPVVSGQTSNYRGQFWMNGITSGTLKLLAADATTDWSLTFPATSPTGLALFAAGTMSALAVTDDAIPTGNGTTMELKVLPSCSDATNSKLLYNSTTNAFSCGTDQTGAGSMTYPGAGIAVSTGSAWGTSLTAPTGALVGAGQGNTFTTGAQDFGSATSLKVPTSAGAAPTASGLIAYDSTANQFKGGVNAANRIFLTSDSSGNTTLPGTLTVPGTGASNFTAIASPAGTPAAGTGDFYLDSTTKRLATKNDAGTVVNYVGTAENIATATALAANGANCTGQVALGVNASGACEGTATPTLGTAGSVVGTLAFANATSGSITLSPVTGALGTVTLSLPATTGTVALTADPVFTGSTQIPNGTGPTVDAAGEVAVDTSTDQFQFYGGAKRALPSIKHVSFVMPAPVETDDFILMKAPYGMTILTIKGVLAGTTNVVGQLQECNSSGASCADLDSDITFNGGEDADDGTLTDSTITSGNWIAWKTTSISGTPTFLTVTVTYRVIPD
jgi:hypothetical protein